jgi:hypothetical protein
LDKYHGHTFKLQNADGSFSTEWFAGRGDQPDLDRRLNTTGHTLEWMVYSLPKDRLTDERLIRAVEYTTDLMWRYRGHEWEIGPKGHAIRALALYDERVLGGQPGRRAEQLASGEEGESLPVPNEPQVAVDRSDPPSGASGAGRTASPSVRRRTPFRR